MANTYKYLDESGLEYYHSLINTNKKLTSGVEYIVGTQSSATNVWTGVSTDTACKNSALYNGKVIIYHLPYAGTSSAATLNLTLPDGTTTGAKTIYRLNNTTVTTTFAAGCDILMIWNGTNWKVNAYVDTNSNTIGYQLRTNSAIWKNKTGYSTNRYTLLFEVDGGLSGASTTIATGTTKTTVAFKYIPNGMICYNTTNAAVANGSNFTATGMWEQYVVDLRYTFNTGSTLTSGKPVYMRCVVNNDGTLTPNYSGSPSHPIVQALPTTADGYVYVFLGQAYSTTNMELTPNHPIYEYTNGKLRLWQYDKSITSSDVTNALGYTPYNSSNPNGYTSNTGTITGVSINNTSIATSGVANLVTNSTYNASTNKIATMNDIVTKNLPATATRIIDLTDGYYAFGGVTTLEYYNAMTTATLDVTRETLVKIKTIDTTENSIKIKKYFFEILNPKGTLGDPDYDFYVGYIQNLTDSSTISGYLLQIPTTKSLPTKVSDLTNDSGFISGITSSMVTTALGYTPYNSTNPNGYTSNTGTITGIKMNGSSKGTSGVVDLGTVLTAHQSIKTINSTSLVGTGNISLPTSSDIPTKVSQLTNDSGFTTNVGTITGVSINGTSIATSGVANLITNTAYNSSTNKIATMSDLKNLIELTSTNVDIWELEAGNYYAIQKPLRYKDDTSVIQSISTGNWTINVQEYNAETFNVKYYELYIVDRKYFVVQVKDSLYGNDYFGYVYRIATTNDIPTIDSSLTSSSSNAVSSSALFDELYYKSGDTLEIGNYINGGLITSSATEVYFSIPTPKRLDNVNMSMTGGKFYIRTTSGQYLQSAGFAYNLSGITITLEARTSQLIEVKMKKTSAYTNGTNNTPLGIHVIDLKISFS